MVDVHIKMSNKDYSALRKYAKIEYGDDIHQTVHTMIKNQILDLDAVAAELKDRTNVEWKINYLENQVFWACPAGDVSLILKAWLVGCNHTGYEDGCAFWMDNLNEAIDKAYDDWVDLTEDLINEEED